MRGRGPVKRRVLAIARIRNDLATSNCPLRRSAFQVNPASTSLRHRSGRSSKTRDEWCRIMEGSDVYFAPVLSMEEAPRHPHKRQRATFVEENGVIQPSPAPRFSRTPSAIQRPPARPGEHTGEALCDWGFSASDLERLRACGAIASAARQKSAAAQGIRWVAIPMRHAVRRAYDRIATR
jgi:CoA transferase family III